MSLSDAEAKERVNNRRVDPKTGILYDMKTKPPTDAAVTARLVQHPEDTPDAFAARLKGYLYSLCLTMRGDAKWVAAR